MADAQASGACSRKAVWVQVPSPASLKTSFRIRKLVFLFSVFCQQKAEIKTRNRQKPTFADSGDS